MITCRIPARAIARLAKLTYASDGDLFVMICAKDQFERGSLNTWDSLFVPNVARFVSSGKLAVAP